MCPAICEVVSSLFYNNTLLSAMMCDNRVMKTSFPHYKKNFPMILVDIEAEEMKGGKDNLSFTNHEQVCFSLKLFNVVTIQCVMIQ